jgi:hypothetical protein
VIVLSAISDRGTILRAAQLGAHDYLLKSKFSLSELTERVRRCLDEDRRLRGLDKSRRSGPIPAKPSVEVATLSKSKESAVTQLRTVTDPTHGPKSLGSNDTVIPALLTRTECLKRVSNAVEGRTLAGVLMQVISSAMSPHSDLTEVAGLIARDSLLTTRVLQVANSACYASKRGPVSSIQEAVRHVGCSTVRNLAMALGVCDAMPATAGDGFNPVRAWSHSLAVATICERLAPPEVSEVAYLVGLCHELGAILSIRTFPLNTSRCKRSNGGRGAALRRLSKR